ncbi:glyceraldehyde-3-phosphate dehydrogenase [Escherichia coli]|nr:glyceraldehyde-3-phosphate dehydrogenase [Escherichia coli]
MNISKSGNYTNLCTGSSSDIIGSHFGSVFDATQTEITAVGDLQLVKTVAWYDNEYGFVTQLIRTLEKFAKL